jgi:hypothetical protein
MPYNAATERGRHKPRTHRAAIRVQATSAPTPELATGTATLCHSIDRLLVEYQLCAQRALVMGDIRASDGAPEGAETDALPAPKICHRR